jgi:hypothetical protein
MITTNFSIVAKLLQSHQTVKEQSRVAVQVQRPVTRAKVEAEPETRLWKICTEVASPRLSGVEWIALLLFGASAIGALAYGFSESFHLFSSGALDQTVRALLAS